MSRTSKPVFTTVWELTIWISMNGEAPTSFTSLYVSKDAAGKALQLCVDNLNSSGVEVKKFTLVGLEYHVDDDPMGMLVPEKIYEETSLF